MKRRPFRPPTHQPTPQELRDHLLDFLRRKYYPSHPIPFAKDQPRLLKWVILWPAAWLDERGVTLPPHRYQAIFTGVFLEAHANGLPIDQIKYLPAYLKTVLQSHFRIHGEEYYEEGKSLRTHLQNAIAIADRLRPAPAPDPVRELATAHRLLKPTKAPRNAAKGHDKDQLSLL